MQRAGILHGPDAFDQRQQQPARHANGMEHRQRIEEGLEPGQVNVFGNLGNVGQDVAMAQHDTLRLAFRPGREQNDGRIVGTGTVSGNDGRSAQLVENTAHLGQRRQGLADVFEIDHAHLIAQRLYDRIEPGLGHKHPRGDDQFDVRCLASRQNIFLAGRKIQHGSGAPMPQKPKQGDRGCVDIGQQQTNHLALPGLAGENPAQHLSAQHKPVIGNRLAGLVFQNGHRLAVPCSGFQQCLRQCQINGTLIWDGQNSSSPCCSYDRYTLAPSRIGGAN